ncbi:MAG: hypothetical protein HYX78_03090 [Armatimonadetes bacterium]|nr:hypothetical protein [Armatimonadota bacterium]
MGEELVICDLRGRCHYMWLAVVLGTLLPPVSIIIGLAFQFLSGVEWKRQFGEVIAVSAVAGVVIWILAVGIIGSIIS